MSVYGRYVVGLLSVWVRDCRSAVGYDSSIVLMIGFQSVSCRLSIGLKSGDSIPILARNDPDMNPTAWFYRVFSNIVGGRQLADSLKILRFLSVSCRFCRCDWGITTDKQPTIYRGEIFKHVWKISPDRFIFIYRTYKPISNRQNRINTDYKPISHRIWLIWSVRCRFRVGFAGVTRY